MTASQTARAAASNCVHVEAPLVVSKKRQSNQSHERRRRKPPQLSATHEIRRLRNQVTEMETELECLERKWTTAIPTPCVRNSAWLAARERWLMHQVNSVNRQLRHELMQQQLVFASLQTAMLHAPLSKWSARDIFEAAHLNTALSTDSALRYYQLDGHCELAVTRARAVMDQFTADIPHHAMPFSQTHITGDLYRTYVANVLVLEFPDVSVVDVYNGVLAYIAAVADETKRHTGTTVEAAPPFDPSFRTHRLYTKVTHDSGFYRFSANLMVVARIVDGVGVVHTDFITQDPLAPKDPEDTIEKTTCHVAMASSYTDPRTGRLMTVFRRIVAYRYDILPNDPILERDLKHHQSIVNGDLLVAVICQYLQQHRPAQRRLESSAV